MLTVFINFEIILRLTPDLATSSSLMTASQNWHWILWLTMFYIFTKLLLFVFLLETFDIVTKFFTVVFVFSLKLTTLLLKNEQNDSKNAKIKILWKQRFESNKLLKSWFHEFLFWWEWISCFSTLWHTNNVNKNFSDHLSLVLPYSLRFIDLFLGHTVDL